MPKKLLPRNEPLSPLRYPGGKARLAAYISGVIEENYLNGCTFYEPFAGGASVSLELLRLGFISNAVLVERDPLVYAFWWCVFNITEDLCAAVEACPVTMETWAQLQATREVVYPADGRFTILQLGVAGLFYNRTNFSGILGAGPIGGEAQASRYKIDCRFNKEKIIRQIRSVARFAERIRIYCDDAITFMRTNAEEIATGFSFAYVDPPYYQQGPKLYRYHYTDTNHVDLAQFLQTQGYPWLLSYDDHPRIRELYNGNTVQPIYLDYNVKSSRTARELAISNLMIPIPVYEGMQELLDIEADA
ncbi:putative DNA methyltransferase [Burkholderia pseudomallei]|uniref:DNA adenine methylase n=1 Tax=Burkholderia pseudomallei TaxID=28450 RepID=UPI0005DB8506|nr:DNA adenine methylase [Burkholderia pseudomallei]MBF3760844.1 DNA adenine methylase [Burkholderia pseudomallei]MBF4128245.1 DNA adenine methylase [Burkholderia pseudomallei]MCV9976539.1 DNA adenine methylase [Burkholderia pseudomallei]MXP97916.1 DNA adenine methylase [Burkholderia pseudomallei]MXQ35798.1 DNA adenine methylase [Burkholderia pseudomallei]